MSITLISPIGLARGKRVWVGGSICVRRRIISHLILHLGEASDHNANIFP